MSRFREIWAEKKRSQPLAARSAGCVFKNPKVRSAGAVIDQCGLKGMAVGGAAVSEAHANFIVTQPDATATDVIRLIEKIRDIVRREFDIELETEIDIW
jgi:UDP-N-acetylmuramate dehydrogenase